MALLMFDLKMRCPSHSYDGEEQVDPKCRLASQWTHTSCGGNSQIYDDCTLRCSKCSTRDHIKNWKFHCNKTDEYKSISALAFADAITSFTAAQTDPNQSVHIKRQINRLVDKLYDEEW